MNFHDLDNYNLADAVKFHQRLNPRLWGKDEHLLPEVRDKLLAIAADFQEFLGVDDLNIQDITISGSNAAYSYTPNSDIDLHLVVDIPDDPVYQELFAAKKYQYNAEHDIKIAGVPVELYVQPSDQKHVSQGIYSVKNGDWTQVPQRRRATIDDSCVQHKTADLDARIHEAIRSGDADAVNQLWKKIKNMRQTGLEQNGEFGCENIAFKLLRNSGCLTKLKKAKTAIQDRELSLTRKPAPRKKMNYGMRDYWYPGTAYAGQDHPAGTEAEQVDEGERVPDWDLPTTSAKPNTNTAVAEPKVYAIGDSHGEGLSYTKGIINYAHGGQPSTSSSNYSGNYNGHPTGIDNVPDGSFVVISQGCNDAANSLRANLDSKGKIPLVSPDTIANNVVRLVNAALAKRCKVVVVLFPNGDPNTRPYYGGPYQEKVRQAIKASVGVPVVDLEGSPLADGVHAVPSAYKAAGSKVLSIFKTINEASSVPGPGPDQLKKILHRFYRSCVDKLKLKNPPRLRLETTPDWSQENGSFGQYEPETNTLILATSGRHVLDILRTMAHEMTHRQQDEHNPLPIDAGETGSPWEDQANAMAGRIMRDWAEEQPEMFDGVTLEEASGYIPTMKQAKDPRFVMALTRDVRPGAVGKEANKLGLETDSQGHPALLTAGLNKLLREFKEQDLFEINMGGKSLRKEAAKTGAIAGMEFEMIVPNTSSEDQELEPDWDMDQSASSAYDIRDFFYDGDYNSRRSVDSLIDRIMDDYSDWQAEHFDSRWDSDQEEFVYRYIKENVDDDEIRELLDLEPDDDITKKEYQLAADMIVTEQMGPWYEDARESAQEDFFEDDNFEQFLQDNDLDTMSGIHNRYDSMVHWPHYTSGGGDTSVQEVADDFSRAVGRPAQARSDYHAYGQERPGPGKNFYVVEPDGSLQPDDSDDSGLEFVSPPLPIDDIMSDLNKVKAWANRMGCYTNDSTGLHINISVPNYSIDRLDYVKLALLMGDEYVLNDFGRASNTYAKSAMSKIRGKVTPENAKQILDKMKSGLDQLATKAIHSGITDKYTSINTKDGHIEFRSPGGDWLDDNFEKIENTLMRFTVAMSAALNPEAYRQEYLKKLYKMLAPKGETDPLAIFAKYAAGELPKAALKSFIRQAQLVRGNKAAQQAELDTMYKDLAPAPGEVNQGNWGIWLGSVNQFSRVPGEYSAGEPVPLRRFPSQEAAEQFLTQTRASNPRMRADAEVREIEPTTAQAAPTDSNQGNWGVWVPSLNRYATIGNLEPRRFLRHGDAQAWIQDYNTRHVGNNVELSVREIEPTTAPAAPEPGSVQWNIINGDNQVAHTFWNTNRQSDANQAGSAWIWSQRLNHFAGRGPWQIVPAANSAASSEPIPGSTQDLQRQRQRDAALAAASMAADAEHAANRRTPTPIPGVQDIEIDIPMAQTQWEVYNRSSNQPVFTMYAENQANAWRKGQEWVATAMQTDPTIDASNFSVRQSAQPVSESREITKLHKLDSVLKKCISMIHRGKQINPKKYGGVAACLIDNKNNHTYAINMPGPNGTRRHAERMAIDKHLKRHGRIGPNAIMVTTLSPCVHDMRERDGESCTELLSDYGIEKCYAGWQDPTQHPATDYPFNLQVTDNADIFNTCQDIAASFLPQVVANELNETVNPDCFDPAFNDTQHFDGLTYRATVQEEHGKPVLTIKVLDDNFQQVGVSKFKQSKKGVVSLITSLKPEYQGQGIARNIYAYVRMLGNTIVPSRNQLPPGKAMWNAWKKSGDAKHLMKDVAEDADGNIEIRSEPTSTGGVQVYAYRDGKEVGWVRFQKAGNGKVKATMVHVPERLRRQGIGSAMYKHARHSLGLDIVPSDSQTADGRLFWNKIHEVEEEPIRINLGNNNAARAFIERVYARYPYTMQNNHVMVWGKGDEQQFAMFELIPSFSKRGAVEVKWFQAYPLRQGVGSKAMKELQAMAREDGISLTLFPWDKGQVSQSKLTKFYRGQGFKPAVKGSKAMQWEPISERKQHPLEDFEGLKFRIVADSGQLFVNALDPTGNNELGHVVFDLDDSKELYPRDLFIKDKFRSQGIARIMYDFVKSKGYTIQRSWDQTDAGSGFWNKHKGEDVRVWEQNDLAEERTHHPDHKFKTAYHITSTENAEEILYSGLDPYDGKAFMVVDEGDKTKLQRELSMVGGWMYAKTEGSDDPLTLLKIDVTGIPLTYDQGWYFSTTKIPPDRIQDLGAKELARYV